MGLVQRLTALGTLKDGVTTLLALVFFAVGLFQYFEYRADQRIEAALDILKRRESSIFVDARATLMAEWFDAKGELKAEFQKTDEYSDELLSKIHERISSDDSSEYRKAMLHISAYYSNAAACVLDGFCDMPTVCASLAGEIQDFYEHSESYLVYLYKLRKEDALTLILDQPEFVRTCSKNWQFNYFSRTDNNAHCSLAKRIHRITGKIVFGETCSPNPSEEILRIIEKGSLKATTP